MKRIMIPSFLPSIAALILFASSVVAFAETTTLSPLQAHDKVKGGHIVLLDIRTPEEWSETGIAEGAWPVSMHSRGFSKRLKAILDVYPADQIALICATGGRSAYVAQVLEKSGVTGVLDVSEGMLGNANGPGWVKSGLPLITQAEAQERYEKMVSGSDSK